MSLICIGEATNSCLFIVHALNIYVRATDNRLRVGNIKARAMNIQLRATNNTM